MNQATLLLLMEDRCILLAMKKRGFGVGWWNGVGGKPNKGETIENAAIRECQEEISVTPLKVVEIATLDFVFPKQKSQWDQQVIVFICDSWVGVPTESEEMAPKWFSVDKIPYSKMWSDDKYWLPRVINGEYVRATFYFDNNDNLLKYDMKHRPNTT